MKYIESKNFEGYNTIYYPSTYYLSSSTIVRCIKDDKLLKTRILINSDGLFLGIVDEFEYQDFYYYNIVEVDKINVIEFQKAFNEILLYLKNKEIKLTFRGLNNE